MVNFDLIIVGAGPTGIACAIEAQQNNLSYIILEKGFLVNSIYNFPTNMTFFSTSQKLEIGNIPFISHNDKPTRLEALEYYRRLVSSYNLCIQYNKKVNKVTKSNDGFTLSVNNKESYKCKYIIIATGFYDNPRLLNVPGEELAKVKHYYDDSHPYIDKEIIVVGAANSACDVALETWQKGANVTMVIRKHQLYPKVKYWILPNIENRIKEGSIKAYFNSSIKEIKNQSVLIGTEKGIIEIENDYVLSMTGYKPDFQFLKELGVILDEKLKKPFINIETLESNIENLYLAGVIISGLNTSELFIENTRHHGYTIINDIITKQSM